MPRERVSSVIRAGVRLGAVMIPALPYIALLLTDTQMSACGDLGITGSPLCDTGGSLAPSSPPTQYEVISTTVK